MENDLDRRLLLGAAGLAGIAALTSRAKAGPLGPPPGPVASSNHTLDEIYNKIAPGGAADGRTPIPGGTTPVTIENPGSYVLTGDLTVGGSDAALTVNAGGPVAIDLNGYNVTSPTGTGVFIAFAPWSFALRNGVIRAATPITTTASMVGAVFEDLKLLNAKSLGFSLGSTTMRSCRISRCHVIETGTANSLGGSPAIYGIYLAGGGHVIEDCIVSRMLYGGAASPTYIGIVLISTAGGGGRGNVVRRCSMIHDGSTALNGNGLFMNGAGVYRDNTVSNFSTPYSCPGATNGGGNV